MKKLQYADEEYYLTSEYILKLASKASELFESSEPEEKRILLKMTLQNLQLDGRKARFEWIKPFDTIALHASRSAWLARWDDYAKINWLKALDYPDVVEEQAQSLLTL